MSLSLYSRHPLYTPKPQPAEMANRGDSPLREIVSYIFRTASCGHLEAKAKPTTRSAVKASRVLPQGLWQSRVRTGRRVVPAAIRRTARLFLRYSGL
jgi:hypothetical protein